MDLREGDGSASLPVRPISLPSPPQIPLTRLLLIRSYEREINLAQRSCIKRIQEHDSPATLPMVLCVSQIRWDEVLDDSAPAPPPGEAPLAIVGLELTDGWYRIRTNVDATLKSACERGKIVVGSKIAMMGAKVSLFSLLVVRRRF